jgi:serine/threonine protein kinase
MESGEKRYVGKYLLDKVLGRGAMGVVYLAKDPTIGRNVAVKCIYLPQGLEEDKVKEFRERFLREARAAGVMNHPNIVTIYEADEGGPSRPPFIAMEYIEGETWNHKIKSGQKLTPDQLFPLLKEIASSLEYAHKANVIHRDIKPGNIIQTADNRAKLMDFGIAKVPTSELTREGQFLGTPAYMSPEQVLGKPVDSRCDLFSLGAVAYEMISGNKPFDGEEITTVLHKIVSEEPKDIREFEGEVSKEAWAIIKKLLRKNIEERYANASELIADLEAYLAGALPPYAQDYVEKTVPPQNMPPIKKKEAPGKKSTRTVIGVVSAVVFAIIVVAATFFFLFRNKTEEDGEPPIQNITKSEPQPETTATPPPAAPNSGEPLTQPPADSQASTAQDILPKPKPKPPAKKPAPLPAATKPQNQPGENKTQAEQRAKLNFSFDLGGTKKGEAALTIDGILIKKQKIAKGVLTGNIWTETLLLKPGKHKIKVNLNTEMMGVATSKEDEREFTAGKETTLKIRIQKITTKLVFTWSE